MKRIKLGLIMLVSFFLLTGCNLESILGSDGNDQVVYTPELITIDDLEHTAIFRKGALAHILEGEINQKGKAVGFHYEGLPCKKGKVIEGTETRPNAYGVYEAEVEVSDVAKVSNGGKSSFFPKKWTAQDVVDAINEAYEDRTFINGNTYEGLTDEGIIVRMYLDNKDLIISAFPVY